MNIQRGTYRVHDTTKNLYVCTYIESSAKMIEQYCMESRFIEFPFRYDNLLCRDCASLKQNKTSRRALDITYYRVSCGFVYIHKYIAITR